MADQIQYRAVRGSHLSKEKAQLYGPILERLAHQHQGVSAVHVLEEARKKSSPLHPEFNWDDASAAEAHRLNQARYLLRAVTVEVVVRDRKAPEPHTVEVRAFPAVGEEEKDQESYQHLSTVMADPDLRKRLVAQALRQLDGWQQRYALYGELNEATQFIQDFLRTHQE